MGLHLLQKKKKQNWPKIWWYLYRKINKYGITDAIYVQHHIHRLCNYRRAGNIILVLPHNKETRQALNTPQPIATTWVIFVNKIKTFNLGEINFGFIFLYFFNNALFVSSCVNNPLFPETEWYISSCPIRRSFLPFRSRNRTGMCCSMPPGGFHAAGAPGIGLPGLGTNT